MHKISRRSRRTAVCGSVRLPYENLLVTLIFTAFSKYKKRIRNLLLYAGIRWAVRPNKNNGVFPVNRPTEKNYIEIADRRVFITISILV